MKFMCLVWSTADTFEVLTPAEDVALTDDTIDADYALRQRGQLVLTQAMQGPEQAVTVKVRNGQIAAHDGPFVESKEWVAGFILIEARDMDEAVAIAGQYPAARIGSIEIRPANDQVHSRTGQGRPAPVEVTPRG